jgi:DNA processing protein
LKKNAYNLAILGSGINRIYPRENQSLANDLFAKGGTIISQFPPEAAPHPSHFPRRNKLLSQLTAGTFVIEGSRASGALITGRNSLELGRSVIVFTQDFRSDFGKGAIELILAGAHPSVGVEEGLEAIARPWGGKLNPLSKNQISVSEENFDVFLARTGLDCRMALIAYKSKRAHSLLKQ